MTALFPYHLVTPSPWPILMAFSAFITALGLISSFHRYPFGGYILLTGVCMVLYYMYVWWRDVARESTRFHTARVQLGLEQGMILFILSEAMFFMAFLWSFIHLASQPSVFIGLSWPPEGIIPVDWTRRPLLNTALLFTSYYSANLARYAVENGANNVAGQQLAITIILGVLFVFYQYLEYTDAPFTMSDSAFGSIFYLSTGFHGFHVIVGVLFLFACFLMLRESTPTHYVALRLAVLYWHFVDMVWIFLIGIVYYWGSYTPSSLTTGA